MHAFILAGGTPDTRSEFIHKQLTNKVELIHVQTEKSSITIKQIQDLAKPLAVRASLPRIVWIEEASLMTIPAQNALLKMLEEPGESTTFYLTCQGVRTLLPTIRSRTQTITIDANDAVADPQILQNIKRIMALSAGDRLMEIGKLDRTETISWFITLEQAIKEKLATPSLTPAGQKMLAQIAKLASNAHLQLTENCSTGLTMQTFYLLLPHTHAPS